jgi:ketosteroid isomerase-like protein
MVRLLLALLLAASSALAEAPPAALPTVDLPPELRRVLTDYETAWHAPRNAAALSSLFAEDGFVLSSGHPPVRGRDAIRQYYTGPGGALSLRAFAFATNGSMGYIIGGFSRGVGTPEIGKFTLTLRKGTDGRWLIVSDMDNGNQQFHPSPSPTPGPPVTPSA